MPGAMAVIRPTSHKGRRAKLSSWAPVVPSGKIAVAMAIWPLRTRVKRSFISSLASPTGITRVTSVVPSAYWPPESTR